MKINNRRFVYPVLSEEKDDYGSAKFQVHYNHRMDGVNNLRLTFDIEMTCTEIQQLIISGYAEYVIHLECSTTAYREVISSISLHIEHAVPIGRINGTLQAVAFVILQKPITGFVCSDWIDDYDGMTFDLFQGSIIAYQNLSDLVISKDYEEFASASSIFSVYRRLTDEDKPAEINMECSQIKIGLGSKDYDRYISYSSQGNLQSVFHSMIILPALVYVFSELSYDYELYRDKEWFIALERAYNKRGVSFIDELLSSDKSAFQLAQEAMELPLSKAFSQVSQWFDLTEEEV